MVVVLGPYMADRIELKNVPRRADRDDSRLEPARRDLPDAARGQPAAQVARAGRRVRRDVLGQPRSGPFVRRVPGGGPAAARPRRHRLPLRGRRPAPRLKSKAAQRARGARQHSPARLLPPRPVARFALAGRRSLDLDAARDDRDRRARQALRRDGRGPAGHLRRSRTLRVGRHDSGRRLRHQSSLPATSTAWPARSSSSAEAQPGSLHGRARPVGIPGVVRAPPLLRTGGTS